MRSISRKPRTGLHLAEIGREVAPGAHGVVVLDGAGWHAAGSLIAIKLDALDQMLYLELVPQQGGKPWIKMPGLASDRREHDPGLGFVINAGDSTQGMLLFLGGALPGGFV